MKRFLCMLISIIFTFQLTACSQNPEADKIMNDFLSAYGADGIVYSPKIAEGNDGYISDGLLNKIYIFDFIFPEDFAIFLNAHTDHASECAVFVCTDANMRSLVEQMCLERVRLVSGSDPRGFVSVSGLVVFYSTMSDGARAKEIWRMVKKG